jgi:hypothetical protein
MLFHAGARFARNLQRRAWTMVSFVCLYLLHPQNALSLLLSQCRHFELTYLQIDKHEGIDWYNIMMYSQKRESKFFSVHICAYIYQQRWKIVRLLKDLQKELLRHSYNSFQEQHETHQSPSQ